MGVNDNTLRNDASPNGAAAPRALSIFAWFVLVYAVVVVVFGSFVRASMSGDGCGVHWPSCQGVLIPSTSNAGTLIEFTHRLTSGLILLLAASLAVWARRALPKEHPARRVAAWSLGFVLISALIGASLVMFKWVTVDRSVGRAVVMPLHLVNTYLLLGSLYLTARYASGARPIAWREGGPLGWAMRIALGGMLLLGATGAISALGKTAFGAELDAARSFADSLNMHLSPEAHPILRGGVFHPLLATSIGIYLLWICGLATHLRPEPKVRKWAMLVVALFFGQFMFGLINLVLGAPIALQLGHLVVAIGNWIALVGLTSTALAQGVAKRTEDPKPQVEAPTPSHGLAMVKDYIALTKPRVISLLLFTTLTAMFIAARGWPGGWLLLAVAVGGYMAAGAANTFNMVIEPDLDEAMGRTANRPTVTHSISRNNALAFGFVLAVGSFGLLTLSANLLCALLAMAGLLFYVFVYTLILKRRTWQNIVIGGAAGAFPPLVGYASVTANLSPLAWYLFAIIFTWTPVHFWALALLLKDDYARAGVPMLPVVRGEKVTVIQISLYTALTAVVSVMPMFNRQVGPVYFVGALILNAGLIAQSLQLLRYVDRPHARSLFKYSMVYLALLFLLAAIDRVGWA